MTGARGGKHLAVVARIDDGVMNDVAEELRARELPRATRGIGAQHPQSFARRNQQ
jgi:hypothetical protein